MSKKHYEAVAKIIKTRIDAAVTDSSANFEAGERYAALNIARDFANLAAADNSKFNRSRFLIACGIND